MVPCHSCHIYEIWRNKEVGDALKSSFGMATQVPNGERGSFYWKETSHYVILLY